MSADITVSGTLGGHMTWADTTQPYVIDNLLGPLTVPVGVTLTINPGVTVQSLYDNKGSLLVQGTLEAGGATFEMLTRADIAQPIVVEGMGSVTFTTCSVAVDRTSGDPADTTALIVAKGSSTLNLVGSAFSNSAIGLDVNRGVWTQDTATLVVADSAGTRSSLSGFPEAIRCESTTAASIADADLSSGSYGIVLDNVAVDLTVSDSTFADFERALQIPNADEVTLTNITVTQGAEITTQTGVYMNNYTSLAVTGAISNMNVGVHVATVHAGQDVSGVTFTNCNWDLLAEGDWNPGNRTVSVDTTLDVAHYHVDNPVTIPAGVTLTIPPGTVLDVKNRYESMFVVDGTLEAEGAIFQPDLEVWDHVAYVRNSGVVNLTDCLFDVSGNSNSGDAYYYTGSCVYAVNDAVVNVSGGIFRTGPRWVDESMRCFTAVDNAELNVQDNGGERVRIEGFKRAVVLDSLVDAHFDGADFGNCVIAVDTNTLANLFAYRLEVQGCGTGLKLRDIGVLVTNDVNFTGTRDAISLTWNQVTSPQVSTAGTSFGPDSYVSLPGNYALDRDLNMRELPYRIRFNEGQVTIPAGRTLTFPAGSEVAAFGGAHGFNIHGTLNATDTTFDFETSGSTNTQMLRFYDDGSGTFTQCRFYGNEIDWVDEGVQLLRLEDNADVLVRGCAFDGNRGSTLGRNHHAMVIEDNARARFESYGGTPCSFADFNYAIYSRYFSNFPHVDIDSTIDNCGIGGMVATNADKTIDTDVEITCPWLTLNADKSVTVAAGASLTFMPGSSVRIYDVRDTGFIFVDGTLRFEGAQLDLDTMYNDPVFVARNSGRLEFVDTQAVVSNPLTWWTESRIIHLEGNSSLLLDSSTFTSTAVRNYPTAYAIVITSPTATVSAPASRAGAAHFEGFEYSAIYTQGLQPLAGTPNLSFGGNTVDINVIGGYTLNSNLTLPPDTHVEFKPESGVTTIASGVTLTVSPGGWIGNTYQDKTPMHTLLANGSIVASDSLFQVGLYRYDDTAYAGDDGSNFIHFAGTGQGTFTNCRFEVGNWYSDWRRGRVFEMSGSSLLAVRGGTFETPRPGDVTWWKHQAASVCRLRDSSTVTIESHEGNGTVLAGFADAIHCDSATAQFTIRDAILRNNGTALLVSQFPAAHSVSGNTFIGNTGWAVNNTSSGQLDCRNNFWGHPSGPRHATNPFGLGDRIGGDILFLPYESQGDVEIATLGDHPQGQAPNAFAAPGSVDDAVLLRFAVGDVVEPSHWFGMKVRMTNREGLADGMITDARLFQDVNGDGLLDGGDTSLATGTVNWAGSSIDFTLDHEMDGDFLLVADIAGLESGDALSLGFASDDATISPAQFVGGRCADANHFLDRLVLSQHPTGPFGSAFLAAVDQAGLPLFGFHLSSGYALRGLTLNFSAVKGLVAANLSGLRLLNDLDGNGREDFGESWYTAETATLSGTTGSATFAFGAEPVPTGTSFVLAGDFVNLQNNDALTVALSPADINAGDGVVVTGSAPASTHAVPAPLMLIDAPFQVDNGFVAASQLNNVPLISFTLTPGGRRVDRIDFDLYDVQGIPDDSIVNARIYVDINQNGWVDSGETTTVGGTGLADIDPQTGAGTLTFSGNFSTQGGDYILVANFTALAADDTLTVALTSEGVGVPANDMVEGGVSPVRHAVYRPDLPQAALQTNWTLTYRSPGGLSASGAYSHDDSKIVLGYSSGTAFTFESDSNTPLTMFHKHFDKVQYAGFSADDSQVVTVTRDGAVYIWNALSGEMENNLFSDLLVRYAVPSPDTARLFIVTEGKALLLDMTTGAIMWEFVLGTNLATSQLYAADYSPDGSMILVGAADKRAYLLDAESGAVIRYYQGHSQAVTGATFAAGGAVIMTSSTDSTVTLWNIGDNVNPIATVTLDGQQGLGSGVSRDGSRIAVLTTQSGTRRLRMFDDTGLELWNVTLPYTHFTGNFSSIRFNSAGDRVLICSNANSDRNWPAALAVQYAALNGDFIGFTGPRGRLRGHDNPTTYQRPRVSEDGTRVFYMHTEGLDVIFPEPSKKIVEFADLADEDSFDITPDGRKLVYVYNYGSGNIRMRYLAVDDDRLTLISENLVPMDAPMSLSRTGGLTILGDSIYRTLTGSLYTNTPNPDAGYRSAFSPDEALWGIAFYDDKSIKTMFVGDDTGSLEYGVTLTDPYKPVKILYHPDGERIGCVDEYSGVQFYRLDDNTPVGLYDYRGGGGIPRLNDAVLSHDGTMLAIARGNSVKLLDMRTGRVLRYFYPTHSGQADCRAYSVGFGARDNMLWIGWSDSYVEIFHRSRVTGLRMTPVTRTLPVGRSQEYTVKAIYDDGSSVDVTPEYIYRATGTELAPGARIYADPPEFATIEAGKVTVNQGAGGNIGLTAIYTEGARTVTAEVTLTVGNSSLVSLSADPAKVTLTPGVLMPIRYTAHFTDDYSEDVTPAVTLSTDRPDRVRIAGNNIAVLAGTDPGTIEVYGRYEYDGVERFTTTTISVHGPESRWERDIVTPGGDTTALQYSPDGGMLAVGSSSGAVTLYTVGATTTQYQVIDVINAHYRPVTHVHFLDNDHLVTIGQDGRIRQWDLADIDTPTASFEHDAVITRAAIYQTSLAFGDNLGRVHLFDLPTNSMLWQQDQHTGEVTAVAINAGYIMSGGEDRRLSLLQRTTGSEQRTYVAFARPPVDCWFDAGQMVVLSGDKRLARWDTGTEDDNLLELFFPSLPTSLTFHGGRMYVGTTNNGANAVWVYDANGLLIRWMDVPPAMGTISALAVTPDGKHVLTGRASAIVEVENEQTGESEEKLSTFHSAQFWDLNRGSYSGSLAHSYSLNDARVTDDGSLIFTQSARRIYRWQARTSRANILDDNKFLETGYFAPYDFDNLELSGAASGLVATRVRDSIYIMKAAERLLHRSVHTDTTRFGLSPDGGKLITNSVTSANVFARFWDISLDFPTVFYENPRPTVASDVDFIDNDYSLGAIGEDMFIVIFNPDGQGPMGITVLPPGAAPEDPGAPGGELRAPTLDNITASGNGNRVGVVVRYIETDSFGNLTSHNYLQVYDISDRGNPARIFDAFLGSVEGEIPPVAMTLSHDGALLFYGLSTQDGEGVLFDLTTQRELLVFQPPSMGTLSNAGPAAAQFTDSDGALMVAWTEGYAEIYRREGLDNLRLSPAARSVAAGETVDLSAWVAYADGAEIDVTGRVAFEVEPAVPATLSGSEVTISAGAPDATVFTVTGTYTELGTTVQATSILTVQDAFFTHLSIDPPKLSLARGQAVTARVFAHFADSSVVEVSTDPGLVWNIQPAGAVERTGNVITVAESAQFGDVTVTCRLLRDGDEHEVSMALHISHSGSMINPGDFDESLVVWFNDLIYFIGHYGEIAASPNWDSRCDFDGDGDVDVDDAGTMIGLYGTDYTPGRSGDPANLEGVSRAVAAGADIWLEGPDGAVTPGDSFEVLVHARENHPEAHGFRGGPISILFDPALLEYDGEFIPDEVLVSPYNSFLTEGTLGEGRIDRLAGFTVYDGYGDGEPVLYARLKFRAIAEGTAVLEASASTSGLVLTPPVGKMTVTSTEFTGDTVVIELGGGTEAEINYDLVAGWNLVGIPLHVNAARSGITRDGLQFYAFRGNGFHVTETVEAGRAYWVFSNGDVRLTIRGFPAEPAGLRLSRGWNLIAPLAESPPDHLPPGVRHLYAWRPGIGQFEGPDPGTRGCPCLPGEGYWIYCEEDGTILWPPADSAEAGTTPIR